MPLNYLSGIQRRSNMKNNKHANPPREVIVVEGRDDTKRLIEAFGKTVQTIETNGSAIDQATLDQIKAAHEKLGVIVSLSAELLNKLFLALNTPILSQKRRMLVSEERV